MNPCILPTSVPEQPKDYEVVLRDARRERMLEFMYENDVGAYEAELFFANKEVDEQQAKQYYMKEHPQPDCNRAAARQPIVLEWMHACVVSYQQK